MDERATEKVLMGLAAIAAVWEILMLLFGKPGATISATLRRMATIQPAIILFYVLLGGHLFWPLIDKAKEANKT